MFLEGWTFGGIYGAIFLLIVGIILIVKGGDFFVDASVWMADELKVPKFLIGATIVAFATTLPELLVSVIASAGGQNEMAIGNAVGSVTANTGLILAISAIFVSGTVNRKDFGIKGFLIILTCLIMLGFSLTGTFGILPSILLLIIFIVHVVFTIMSAKKKDKEVEVVMEVAENVVETKTTKKEVIGNIVKFILGAAGIIIGANLLIDNATVLAYSVGISEGIVAITIVAIGTSLPELVTTITAIVKKQGELGVGNVIGANLIDLVLILPICSFISKGNLVVSEQAYMLDIPAMLLITLIAIVPTIITKKFSKIQGVVMLVLYIAYIVLAAVFFGAGA